MLARPKGKSIRVPVEGNFLPAPGAGRQSLRHAAASPRCKRLPGLSELRAMTTVETTSHLPRV